MAALLSLLQPSSDPEHRAKRQALEKDHPHFDVKETVVKGSVLLLLAGAAMYPTIKAEVKEGAKELEGKVKDRLGKGNNDSERKKSVGSGKSENRRNTDDRRKSTSDRRESRSERNENSGARRASYPGKVRYDSGHDYDDRYWGRDSDYRRGGREAFRARRSEDAKREGRAFREMSAGDSGGRRKSRH